MSKKNKAAIAPVVTTTPVELTDTNAHLVAFAKAAASFNAAHGSFKARTVSTVTALRGEGYDDATIKRALRAVIEKLGASPQMLNLVFRTPVEQGGCGMPPDRIKPKGKGSPAKVPVKVSGRAATGGSNLNLRDSKAVYAAALVTFEGDNLALAKWAEEIHALALEGASKLGKGTPAPAPAPTK